MSDKSKTSIPPGWKGGFRESNPDFDYPVPDLSCLPMRGNMDNITKLTRQLGIRWPEFSWLTDMPAKDSRAYVMFSPYISRIGYTDEGQIFSIICPQQGMDVPGLGTLNVEITVTGQRGWVDETDLKQPLAADMTVEGTVWFSPSSHQNKAVKLLWGIFDEICKVKPFPGNKEHAIKVKTNMVGVSGQPAFPILAGTTTDFPIPDFARHDKEAFSVGNIEVQIGEVTKTGDEFVDKFNQLVINILNLSTGNMLQADNVLAWNIWFHEPELVDQEEWRTHAERWRKSIDEDHGSPTGPGRSPRHFDGSPFSPMKEELERAVIKLGSHIMEEHFRQKIAEQLNQRV